MATVDSTIAAGLPLVQSDEELEIRQAVARICEPFGHLHRREITDIDAADAALRSALADHGFLAVNIGEEWGGGGQPYGVDNERRRLRAAGLYRDDREAAIRCSHENPEVVRVYREFLGEPLGGKAHALLHTRYTARPLYKR